MENLFKCPCWRMVLSTSTSSLSLYRALLRYGENLVHTDKKFFVKRIRTEFRAHRDLTDPKEILDQKTRAVTLLQRAAIK